MPSKKRRKRKHKWISFIYHNSPNDVSCLKVQDEIREEREQCTRNNIIGIIQIQNQASKHSFDWKTTLGILQSWGYLAAIVKSIHRLMLNHQERNPSLWSIKVIFHMSAPKEIPSSKSLLEIKYGEKYFQFFSFGFFSFPNEI